VRVKPWNPPSVVSRPTWSPRRVTPTLGSLDPSRLVKVVNKPARCRVDPTPSTPTLVPTVLPPNPPVPEHDRKPRKAVPSKCPCWTSSFFCSQFSSHGLPLSPVPLPSFYCGDFSVFSTLLPLCSPSFLVLLICFLFRPSRTKPTHSDSDSDSAIN